MSNVRNFCISVNLCLWFNDHRHKARIFINDNILTISDLERRIEEIFKIKNFHLTSQNDYLPSSEDVRILQPNDVVWVMRNNSGEENILKTTPEVVMANPESVIINRKRSISVTQDHSEQDTRPVKKKKKRKQESEESGDINYPSPPREEPKRKKKHKVDENSSLKDQVMAKINKKIKNVISNNLSDTATSTTLEDSCSQDKSSSMKINKLLPVLHSHIKSYNNKVNKRMNETEAASTFLKTSSLIELDNSDSESYKDSQQVYTCKGILQAAHEKNVSLPTTSPLLTGLGNSELDKNSQKVYKCKGALQSYKKKYSVPTITDKYLQEKKVNLVKIEYVSSKPTPYFPENMETISSENQDNSTSSAYSYTFKNADSGIDHSSVVFTPENDSANQENRDDRSITKLKQSEIFSTEKEGNSNQSNTAIVNESESALKDLNNTISEEVMEVTESEPQSFKQVNITDNLLINMSSSLLSQDKECTSLDAANEFINKFDPVCKTDISVNGTKFKSSSSDAVPNISNNATEVNVENIVETLNDSQSKVDNLANCQNLETTSCDVSKNISSVDTNINGVMENVSKELHIDEVNGTASEISQKESTEGPTLLTETMNSNDSNKNLDVDLTEDVTDSLLDASIETSGTKPIYLKRKQLSGIGQLLGELRDNESLVTGESMESDHSEFVTKRSRKRVRKRKRKNNAVNNTSLSDSSFVENFDYVMKPKPIKTRACPTIHLKFEEDAEHLRVVDVNKKTHEIRASNESNMETSGVENITIESDVEQSNVENFTIKEEYILKSPSIKNSLPKIGDIIAFKILRIENYTPEVSSYIIGKVIDFNHSSKVVLYDILNGIELIPEEADQNCDSRKRKFMWTDIIDPRLLFP